MNQKPMTSLFARVAFALLCAMWTVTGWYVFLTGSFTTSPKRSNISTTVTGLGAEFLGLVFIALGLIALALLLQGFKLSKAAQALWTVLLLIVPPIALKVWFLAP
jgi:hypothetical protein